MEDKGSIEYWKAEEKRLVEELNRTCETNPIVMHDDRICMTDEQKQIRRMMDDAIRQRLALE